MNKTQQKKTLSHLQKIMNDLEEIRQQNKNNSQIIFDIGELREIHKRVFYNCY